MTPPNNLASSSPTLETSPASPLQAPHEREPPELNPEPNPELKLWRTQDLIAPPKAHPPSRLTLLMGALVSASLALSLLCLSPALTAWLQGAVGAWSALSLSFGGLSLSLMGWFLSQRHLASLGGAQAKGVRGSLERPLSSRGVSAWLMSGALTALYLALYFKPALLKGWVALIDPLAHALTSSPAEVWFLYSALYSGAVLTFSVRSLLKGRGTPYVLWRTLSVTLCQLGLAFLIPYTLKAQGLPEFYPSYFWPLKPDYLLPFDYIINAESGLASVQIEGYAVGRALLLWSLLMSVVATPLLTYRYGKRWYCSWVCGCGALAETAGDPWRHLSFKGERSLRVERSLSWGVLLTITLMTLTLWVNEWSGRALLGSDGSGLFWGSYGLVIQMCFSGVIGVGFYPLLGSRSWCRFGCPQAKILGLLQRAFKTFAIKSEAESCVSCGRCSEICEMGIDVRAYAQRGELLIRESCVGCGACVEVCPRDVLKLK